MNYYYEFSHSGNYQIHARRSIRWMDTVQDSDEWSQQAIDGDVAIELKTPEPDELPARLEPYVRALKSQNEEERRNAEEAIAYAAPAFLEPVILKMVDSEDWAFGVLGLRNLNTPTAREKLSQIVLLAPEPTGMSDTSLTPDDQSAKRDQAIQALGETAASVYFPVVLKAASEAPIGSQTRVVGTWAVGRLGREKAIPFLASEVSADTDGQRLQGALGLGFTASREAVPMLIRLLQSPEEDVRQVAENSLRNLTHRAAVKGSISNVDPALLYRKWQAWWTMNGATAPIYAVDQCGETLLLD